MKFVTEKQIWADGDSPKPDITSYTKPPDMLQQYMALHYTATDISSRMT